jgi:hypothetical protein
LGRDRWGKLIGLAAGAWVLLVCMLNALGIAGMMFTADSFGDDWQRLADVYNPFNVWNWVLNLVLLAPALALYSWRASRQGRVSERNLYKTSCGGF